MDKTININLGGSLFQVDEEAFNILRDYIQSINNRFRNVPGGPETIEDIEFRIAEIFRSQKGLAGVITRQNVEAMITTIGKPEDFDNGMPAEDPVTADTAPKRLYRNPEDYVISGVCGGLGAYLNTDPVLFRILFILAALLGGAGILIYLVLWIAVPWANTDSKKREMYGRNYYTYRNPDGSLRTANNSSFSNVFSEIINAIGKVFYVIARIFLIILGICLVITGFLFIITFVMIFVLKIPDAFTHQGIDFSISYIPHMLQYIFNPASAPWIWALSIIVFLLPMIALVYWGVKMIFWFSVRDGIFNLTMLIIWVVSLSALSILVFNEGVSFAEVSSVTSKNILKQIPDTLYLVSGNKLDKLDYDKEFITPDNGYSAFIVDSTRNLYIKPRIHFRISEDKTAEIEISKHAAGRNRREASDNASSISYDYKVKKDSVVLDEYFVIPSGKKWSADFVNIKIHVPQNTILYLDKETAGLIGRRTHIEGWYGDENDDWDYAGTNPFRIGGRYWTVTENGLREAESKSQTR